MPTARKTKSGKWSVLARVPKTVNASGYKHFTAETKKDAERMASIYQEEQKCEQKTVKQAIEKYIEIRKNVFSPATVRNYHGLMDTSLQRIMETPVSQLSQDDIQAAVNEDALKHSPKTVRCAYGLLKSSIAELRPDFAIRAKLPAKVKTDISIPTSDQVAQLVRDAEYPMNLAILLASQMGLRRAEISALKKEDCKDGYISVSKATVYDEDGAEVVKSPKTYAGYRKIMATPDVKKEIKKIPETEEQIVPLSPRIISMRFNRLLKKNPQIPPFRFHDLRHYYASMLLSINIPTKYVMERMGHKTDNMLKTVYEHTMAEREKKIDKDISECFSSSKSKKYNKKYNNNI